MTREEKQKAIDALKISAPIKALTPEEFNDYIQTLNKVMDWIEQEPTIKNNLGVDYISRAEALGAIRKLYPGMPRVDFSGSLRKWVDKYKPYIECDDAIKELPSATPIDLNSVITQHIIDTYKAESEKKRTSVLEKARLLDKIIAEIKEWYWQADKQALAKDPCVVDAMIDLFIRTIDKYKAKQEQKDDNT